MALIALLVVVIDLAAKASVQESLGNGRRVDLGLIDLQLGYNPGAAFGLGASLPRGVVLAFTAAVTAAVLIYAWRCSAAALRVRSLALTAVAAGAVGNLIDRAGDGVVTDYLHTTWWPTFNLADVSITLGALTLMVSAFRREDAQDSGKH